MSDGPQGPLFGSWDEAMAHMREHPDDLGKPWYVAPDADLPPSVYRAVPDEPYEWPSGWRDLGYTEDGPDRGADD